MNRIHTRNARLLAVLVVVALAAAACGTEATSTTAIDPGSGAAAVDGNTSSPAQPDGDDPGVDPTTTPSPDVAVTGAPAQTPSAATNNDVAGGNYPSFVGSTSNGASFEMASLAGEDVILWFWAPW